VTNVADTTPAAQPSVPVRLRSLLTRAEINLRLAGMLVALAVIIGAFNILSGGDLFQPTNMVTLAIQATSVAIIATGMVLVIVSRNIDLSVGSLTGFIAMSYALLMTDWLPNVLGMSLDFPFRWLIALGIGIAIGAGFGAVQGFIVAYIGVPSFVVTLGGLLSIRGAVWYLSNGAGVFGLDQDFQLLSGGTRGSIGGTLTWVVGAIGCVAVIALLWSGRRQRRRFGFPVRPMWAEVTLAVLGCAALLWLAFFANGNYWPVGPAHQYAIDNNITEPPGGLLIPVGFPIPLLLLVGVTLVMSWLATRRSFGRYVYAYGGNPDAAELAGINTRWTIMKTFILMGVLCALAAAVAAARLNGSTLDVGNNYELYVIAAAVVGGTTFAGGIGTIPGAVLGAFVMTALKYGLSFLSVNSPGQNVAAGIVLIAAVAFDAYTRRRVAR
jgi:D-xylose transport system permease protein